MTKYVRSPIADVYGHRGMLEYGTTRATTLNSIMEFDRVVRVTDGGDILDDAGTQGVYAPELNDGELDGSALAYQSGRKVAWSLIGNSGQQGGGQIMHNSEFIGGRLADEILSTPGLYVAIVCNWSTDGCPACGEQSDHCQGHGEIGDPEGALVINAHENGDHDSCHADADCKHVAEGWAVAHIPDES